VPIPGNLETEEFVFALEPVIERVGIASEVALVQDQKVTSVLGKPAVEMLTAGLIQDVSETGKHANARIKPARHCHRFKGALHRLDFAEIPSGNGNRIR